MNPIIKWVGGKRQLLNEITLLLPKEISTYCEPFIGGGAVFFSIQPDNAIINDLNSDLIAVYETVKDNVDDLIKSLKQHKNTAEYFYSIRDLDRNKEAYEALDKIEKASRFIYLNKTCFNGLFRVNASGEFNTPYGRYKRPNIVNEEGLRTVSEYFNNHNIQFHNEDFAETLNRVEPNGFVYLDPPYDPISTTANFTGYNKGGFDKSEQVRLKECCDQLNERGIHFMLSNSATDFIKDLYKDYNIKIVKAKRAINSNGKKRGAIDEVLVRNYD